MNSTTDKAALRRALRDLPPDPHETPTHGGVALRDIALPHLAVPKIVAIYLPMRDEIDPRPLGEALRARGARIVAPRFAIKDAPMTFHLLDEHTRFDDGAGGIPQPSNDVEQATPDLLLVPFLAADEQRHRLGQGAGFYDRTLARLRAQGSVVAVGVGWDRQIVAALPVDGWDQPLDAIATPTRWIAP